MDPVVSFEEIEVAFGELTLTLKQSCRKSKSISEVIISSASHDFFFFQIKSNCMKFKLLTAETMNKCFRTLINDTVGRSVCSVEVQNDN